MASSRQSLSDTLRLGSDDWHEHPCVPCSKEGRNVAAVKFCVDCDDNVCGKCVSDHNKFAVTRGHRIEDKPRKPTGQRKDLPITRCAKHGGKLVDIYCPKHDTVGCSTCSDMEHSNCGSLQYIPDVAKGIQQSKALVDLETKITAFQKRLDELKGQKEDRLKLLKFDKEEILKEIKALRKRVNDYLDEMESKLVSEADCIFIEKIKATEAETEEISDMKVVMGKTRKTLKDARDINEAELFVQVKMSSAITKENSTKLGVLDSGNDGWSLKFLPCKEIEKFMAGNDYLLGRISVFVAPKSSILIGNFKISLASEAGKVDIADICMTTKGNVLLSDCGNKRLKKLDSSYNVKECLEMPDEPFCINKIDSNQLAVTLPVIKTVQLVYQEPLSLGKSFKVRDTCADISHHDGLMYVCYVRKEKPEFVPIDVYNLKGELLRSHYVKLELPRQLLCLNRNEIVVLDIIKIQGSRLIKVELNENNVSEIENIKNLWSVCRLGYGQFCGASFGDKIMLFSEDGKLQQDILTKEDGVHQPITLCFDEKQNRLIIYSLETDFIQVFQLK